MSDLVQSRKQKCIDELRIKHPDLVDMAGSLRYAPYNPLPPTAVEYVVWDEMEKEVYWRSHHELEHLFAMGEGNRFSGDDLSQITEVLYQQILRGKQVASSVPLFQDVWTLIGKGVLKDYVTDKHKSEAVNKGFWDLLKSTSDEAIASSAGQQLDRIMAYEDFFHYFDFKKGVEKAAEMPTVLDLARFTDWYTYMRWYLVQEHQIHANVEEGKALDICGRLVAPLIDFLLTGMHNVEEETKLRRLATTFIQGDILSSEPVQHVLGEIFEQELEDGFDESDYFSEENLEICERCLKEPDKHAAKVWKEVRKAIDISRIPKEVEQYVPKEAYADYVGKLKQDIENMPRIDVRLFGKWMQLRPDEQLTKALYSLVRNKALEKYFSQRSRPSASDLERLVQYNQKAGNLQNKLRGFLFMDLLYRKSFRSANEILFLYDDATEKNVAEFQQSIQDYVATHGQVKVSVWGLEANACYPRYNKLSDFCARARTVLIIDPK
jgi:hypothetical protein